MGRPTSSSPLGTPSHSKLHSEPLDIRMFSSSAGTGGDDTAALNAAIAESDTAGGSIFLPYSAAGYNITSTIDLSGKTNVHIIGGHTGISNSGLLQGQYPPATIIGTPSGLSTSAMFYSDGGGASSNHKFENLSIYAGRTGFHYKDTANVKFRNVSVRPGVDDGNSLNASIVMQNTFWCWYNECAFHSPLDDDDDPSVILLSQSPPDAGSGLQRFRDTTFWGGGVNVQMNDALPSSYGAVHLTDCLVENSAKALVTITGNASSSWRFGSLSLRNCETADPTVATEALVNLNQSNCILSAPVFESCGNGNTWALQIDAGTVEGAVITGAIATGYARYIVNSAGTLVAGNYTSTKMIGLDIVGDDSGTEATADFNNHTGAAQRFARPGEDKARHGVSTNGKHYWGSGSAAYDTNLYREAADTLATDDKLHVVGETEIDGALNHDGTTVGFYGVTPATRPTAYTQTYSTADKTHANFTSADLATTATTQTTPYGFATQAQGDNIATQFNLLRADVADLKQLVNSVIDDLQTLGILQ